MALTSQEKADLIFQLGWPGLTIVADSTDYNKTIVDNLDSVSSQMEPQIRNILSRIKKLDSHLEEALCRLSASQVGDITLNKDEIYLLRKEKKNLLREVSDLLDIPIMRQGSGGVSVCV